MNAACFVYVAEKTHIVGAVDVDSRNGLVVAVEIAGKFLGKALVGIAYGCISIGGSVTQVILKPEIFPVKSVSVCYGRTQ